MQYGNDSAIKFGCGSRCLRMPVGTEHGRVENIVLAIFGISFGVRALYGAYTGVWPTRSILSRGEPVREAWYLRAFLVLAGLWAIYGAVYFLRR
jgi:hypothetical protein